jgi:hypothetical protein
MTHPTTRSPQAPARPRGRSRTWRHAALCALLLAGLAPAGVPAAAAAAAPAAPTTGTLARNEPLRAEARDDATTVQKLNKGAKVQVLFREGAWYRVDHDGQLGWVRLYWVRTGGAKVERANAAPVRSIADSIAAARSRRNQNQITASLGVRGLSEEELKGAHYDAEQLAKLDKLAVDTAAAERFAAAGPVTGRSVDEITAGRSSRR